MDKTKLLSIKIQTARATNMVYGIRNVNTFLPGFQLGIEMTGWGESELKDEPLVTIKLDQHEYRIPVSKLKKILQRNIKSFQKEW